jgi:1,6-anhydro-N-acetylmuramate kinase
MDSKIETPHFLGTYKNKKDSLIIGLMSGTSLDGVDATLVRIPVGSDDNVSLLYHYYLPYSHAQEWEVLFTLASSENSLQTCQPPGAFV